MAERKPRAYYQNIERPEDPKAAWRKQAMLHKDDPETESNDTKRLNRTPGSRPRAQVLNESGPAQEGDEIDLIYGRENRKPEETPKKNPEISYERKNAGNSGERSRADSGMRSEAAERRRKETDGRERPEAAERRGREEPRTLRTDSVSRKRNETGTGRKNSGSQEYRNSAQGKNVQRETTDRSKKRKPSKNKNKKVFSPSFVKGFLIAWGIFVVLLIVGMVILWNFLNRYEKGLPEHYLNQIIEELGNGNVEGLHLVTEDDVSIDDPSLLVSKEEIGTFLSSKNKEEPLRYVKLNAESSEDENVYVIRSGDETLLKVYMDRNSENGKQENGWHESKTQMSADELKLSTLTVQIPTTASLEINGTAIDRSQITEAEAQIKLLSNLIGSGLVGPQPTVDTYTVRGIFADPEIVMVTADGNRVPCTEFDGLYSAGFEADEAFAAEQTDRVMGMFEPYAKYFSGDAGREALDSVMLSGSPAYWNATAADVSWMQAHDGIRLSDESVKNIRKYSDDCYSCEISFKEEILQGGEPVRVWDTNMTWIMVKDGNYYLADLVTKTADE